jgi:hypothetical protein
LIYQQLVTPQSGGIHAEAAPDIASSEPRVTIIRTNLRICKAPYFDWLDSQNLSPGKRAQSQCKPEREDFDRFCKEMSNSERRTDEISAESTLIRPFGTRFEPAGACRVVQFGSGGPMPTSERLLLESWNRTLHSIPTVFGRLAWLASLRNQNSGAYEHFGMAQRSSAADVDRIVRDSHLQTFQQWLGFTLEEQKQELSGYFDDLGMDRREVLSNWLSLNPYLGWVPPGSRDVERTLFLSDLGLVLESFRSDYGVAARDPDL